MATILPFLPSPDLDQVCVQFWRNLPSPTGACSGSPNLTFPAPASVSRPRVKGYKPEKKQPPWSWLGARVLILPLIDLGSQASTSPWIKQTGCVKLGWTVILWAGEVDAHSPLVTIFLSSPEFSPAGLLDLVHSAQEVEGEASSPSLWTAAKCKCRIL